MDKAATCSALSTMTGQRPDGTVDAEAGVDVLTLIRETQLVHGQRKPDGQAVTRWR